MEDYEVSLMKRDLSVAVCAMINLEKKEVALLKVLFYAKIPRGWEAQLRL
jgi:hypothetical protein